MKKLVIATILLSVCSACSRGGPEGSATNAPASAASPSQLIAAVGTDMFRVSPATLPDCQARVVEVDWDVSKDPAVGAVEVWVGSESAQKLFASGGNKGRAPTGAWSRPGEQFTLKNAAGRGVLGRAVIGGPRCP